MSDPTTADTPSEYPLYNASPERASDENLNPINPGGFPQYNPPQFYELRNENLQLTPVAKKAAAMARRRAAEAERQSKKAQRRRLRQEASKERSAVKLDDTSPALEDGGQPSYIDPKKTQTPVRKLTASTNRSTSAGRESPPSYLDPIFDEAFVRSIKIFCAGSVGIMATVWLVNASVAVSNILDIAERHLIAAQTIPISDDRQERHSNIVVTNNNVEVVDPTVSTNYERRSDPRRGFIFDANTGKLIPNPTPETVKDREIFTVLSGKGCSAVQTLKLTEDGWKAVDPKPFTSSPAYHNSLETRRGFPETDLCR